MTAPGLHRSAWADLASAIEHVARAHAELETARLGLEDAVARNTQASLAGDIDQLDAVSAEMRELAIQRRYHKAELEDACETTARKIDELAAIVEEDAAETSLALLTSMRTLSVQARDEHGPQIAASLRRAAEEARSLARGRREETLAPLLGQIRGLVGELRDFGGDPVATDRFLADELWLTTPLAEARVRLENECATLRASVDERRRAAARASADKWKSELEGTTEPPVLAERLAELESFSEPLPPSETRALGTVLLRRVANTVLSHNDADSWAKLAKLVVLDEAGPRALVELLPDPEDGDLAELLAPEVFVGVDEGLAWSLAQELRESSRTEWEQGLLRATFGRRPQRPEIAARWLVQHPGPTFDEEGLRISAATTCTPLERWLVLGPNLNRPTQTMQTALASAIEILGVLPQASDLSWPDTPPEAASAMALLRALCAAAEGRAHDGHATELGERGFPNLQAAVHRIVRDGLASLGERKAQMQACDELSLQLTDIETSPRSLVGAPANEVWKSTLLPALMSHRTLSPEDLGSFANNKRISSEAEKLVREAVRVVLQKKRLNPKAHHQLVELATAYLKVLLELRHLESHLDGTAALLPFESELDRIAELSPLGSAVVRVWRQSVDGRTWSTTGLDDLFERAREAELKQSLRSWAISIRSRLETSSWTERGADDVLWRIAGLATPERAIHAYARKRRYDLITGVFEAFPERVEDLRHLAADELRAATAELHATLEQLVGSRLSTEFISWFVESSTTLRATYDELEARHRFLDSLLSEADPASTDLARLDEQVWALAEAVDHLSDDYRTHAHELVDPIASTLRDALDRLSEGQVHELPGGQLVLAFQALSEGNIDIAKDALAGRALSKEAVMASAQVSVSYALDSYRTRTFFDIDRLDRFTKRALSEASQTDEAPHEKWLHPWCAALNREGDARSIRLEAARWLRRQGSDEWFAWAAAWAFDECGRLCAEGQLRRAQHAAQASLTLLGHALESREVADATEVALRAWLEITLSLAEGASATIATAQVAHLEVLVRRFVEHRRADLLAWAHVQLSDAGGLALRLLIGHIRTNDLHLRSLLLGELLGGGLDLSDARVWGACDLLAPWIDAQVLATVPDLFRKWESNSGPLDRLLSAHEVPALIQNAVFSSLSARRGRSAKSERVSIDVSTSTIYLDSADPIEEEGRLVISLHYRDGPGPLEGFVVKLGVEPANALHVQSELDVPALRPGDRTDLDVNWRPHSGTPTPRETKLSVALFRRRVGGDERLVRRQFLVSIRPKYPHGSPPTPYVAGKCVRKLELIKGREDETEKILQKLRGAHDDNLVLVYGMRRIGKSTLLQKLSIDERVRAGYAPVHLDLEGLLKSRDTVASFLAKVAKTIAADVEDGRARKVPLPSEVADPFEAFKSYLLEVASALGGQVRLLLLFDEFQMLFERASDNPDFADLVKSFRHWVQFTPVSFIVAGTRELRDATLGRGQRLFQLGLPVELGALRKEAATDLICEPVRSYYAVTRGAEEMIRRETHNFPNLIQTVCADLFLRVLNRRESVASTSDVEVILGEVAKHKDHFQFLLEPVGFDLNRWRLLSCLADLTLAGRNATPEEILAALRSNHPDSDWSVDQLDKILAELVQLEVVTRISGAFAHRGPQAWRVAPPLVARHIQERDEYHL